MEKTLTDKLIDTIRKAQIDLEEFKLQFALGKADARVKYEELKKKFNTSLQKTLIKVKTAQNSAKVQDLRAKLEDLQVQLTLGKAETRDAFNAQRKRILKKIESIEKSLGAGEFTAEISARLKDELEKFKIKLEILRLQFELNRFDARKAFEARMTEFSKKLKELNAKVQKKKDSRGDGWEHFNSEMSQAYEHLKKAILN